jgi:hypothetical protein
MSTDKPWKDKPATKKQIKFLSNIMIESFSDLSRGEASDMIQEWSKMKADENINSYSKDTLEENK